MRGLTPTERCIMERLSDGQPHTRRELHECLPDDLGALGNIKTHISNIRKKLPRAEEIVCVLHKRTICYRHVMVLGVRTFEGSAVV